MCNDVFVMDDTVKGNVDPRGEKWNVSSILILATKHVKLLSLQNVGNNFKQKETKTLI